MEAIIFIGLQASGKSTFYKNRFFNSHVRISNDLLKTKNREKQLLAFCKATEMSLVVDNTNVTKAVRLNYIQLFKTMPCKIIGYYFQTDVKRALEWNSRRTGKDYIPEQGILGTYKRLELPSKDEGYDALFYVVDYVDNQPVVKEWQDEI